MVLAASDTDEMVVHLSTLDELVGRYVSDRNPVMDAWTRATTEEAWAARPQSAMGAGMTAAAELSRNSLLWERRARAENGRS